MSAELSPHPSTPLTPEQEAQHHAEDIAHAKHHLVENYQFFIAFFALITVSVLTSSWMFDFSPQTNFTIGMSLIGLRSAIIAWFFAVLIGRYVLISRFFLFTGFFLLGMIFLTLWTYHNPIVNLH